MRHLCGPNIAETVKVIVLSINFLNMEIFNVILSHKSNARNLSRLSYTEGKQNGLLRKRTHGENS